jgi:signal transduction histidine kinase
MQNSICRKLWGDLVGERPEDLDLDESTLSLWLANNRRAFSGEVVKEEVQFEAEGEPRHFYNVISPVLDGGRILGILGINLDITDRKRAEEALMRRNVELRRANQELERVSRAKDHITAMISHELRSPLVAGLGYLDMLLEGKLGPVPKRVRSRMEIAQKNLRRLSTFIDRVLKYQQLLSARSGEALTAVPFELSALVEEAVTDVRDTLEEPGRLRAEVSDELPQVWGDKDLIRMVLDNLLGNAVLHAGPEASIRVLAMRSSSQGVRVAVEDDGPGIPAEIAPRAFEPFVKSPSNKQGSGLGLAIVQAILRAHRTEAVLESDEGRGTTVSFWLATEAPVSTPAETPDGGALTD